ncbi:hypothetical protein HPT25_20605 [Bacillus sp. BRMEA1]|uniref:hypothetical protein n=1 Tax=Neobacillus endophyticus TaxID=2738405 RepID=UPI0015635968|nr:hypothetical protein [Neobacillus endophyticus]NRD79747.1 hypothetical protein [Neobacillus endophyticus]
MKIYSTSYLSKVICAAVSLFFLFSMFHLYQLQTLTSENVVVFTFFLTLCFFLFVYMDSHSIEIGSDSIIYTCFNKKSSMFFNDIHKIEITYFHQNIRTISPVLHIIGKMNKIEIPYGLFERNFFDIHQMLQRKVPLIKNNK